MADRLIALALIAIRPVERWHGRRTRRSNDAQRQRRAAVTTRRPQ